MLHFYKTPGLLKSIFSDLVWDIPTKDKTLYLSFDDGPVPHLTDYILDQLQEYDAKATFFCVGDNIRKHPDLAEKIVSHGHTLGNHTYNHLKGWTTPNEIYEQNTEHCQAQIAQFQQQSKPLFRPPHGQISINQIRLLKQKYRIIMWDVLAYDFDNSQSAQKSLQKSIKHTKSGSIVVLHDNYKAEEKLKYLLPRYLKHFNKKGFSFKNIEP